MAVKIPRTQTLVDNRRLGFFMIENKIFDSGTAARIGPYATTVYSYLVYRAGNKDRCYPKLSVVCDDTGISEPTVIKSIDRLIDEKLISKTKTKTVNHYTIEDHLQTKRGLLSESSQTKREIATDSTTLSPPLTRTRHTEQDTRDMSGSPDHDPVNTVFNNWKTILEHPKAVLDGKRRTKIKQALKAHPVADLKKAFQGCSLSPFHMGDNDRLQRYDDIALILRDAGQIEKFMNYADHPPQKREKPYSPETDTRPRRPLT